MRTHGTIALVVTLSLLLIGCGTKYQEMGFTGGVSAEQITKDTYRIVARGNRNTRSTTVQDYALLKAAETTKDAGATHFVIISAADATTAATVVVPGTSTTTFSGNTAYRRGRRDTSTTSSSRARTSTSES